MSFWQANCFEMVFEVWGQTFKMIILTCILLYSRVFLHLLHNAFESNKIRLKKKKTVSTHFPNLHSVSHFSLQDNKSLKGKSFSFSFHWVFVFELVAFVYMKNCIGKKKICMHSIFKLEIQAVQSLDYYPNAKQKRKIPHQKNQYVTFIFSLYVYWFFLHFTERVYIIISNNQSLFCFHYKYWKWFRMTQKMFLLICSKEKKSHILFLVLCFNHKTTACCCWIVQATHRFLFQAGQHFAVF